MDLTALFAWPVVVILLYRFLPFRDAMIWAIVGGYLLLPSSIEVGIDLPFFPPYDKNLVPPVAAAIIGLVAMRQTQAVNLQRRAGTPIVRPDVDPLPGWIPRSFLGISLLLGIVLGILAAAMTNRDYLQYGDLILPGQGLKDVFSNFLVTGVTLLPMLLGRKYLSDYTGHKRLLTVLFFSALLYTLPALYEVRMSPQLNRMVYDFFPHSWVQHVRAGGFRPLVFLDHGLLLGIYFACALIAGAILIRVESGGRRFIYAGLLVWLFGALFLAKTVGAFMIALVLMPVALLMSVRLQLMTAAVIAIITLVYPTLRSSGIIPTDAIIAAAYDFDAERGQSLEFRFDNEDLLLDKAAERIVFGWGWWGRSRVYDDDGNDISTTDGAWVIIMGQLGWVGYLSHFGLLTVPILVFFRRRRRYNINLITSGLCLLTAANLIDLLPNDSLRPVLWLCAGALLGRLERAHEVLPEAIADRTSDRARETELMPALEPDPVMTRYSRFSVNKTREGQISRPVVRK